MDISIQRKQSGTRCQLSLIGEMTIYSALELKEQLVAGLEECQQLEEPLLDVYFEALKGALRDRHPDLDAAAVESEWRALYAPAWADFHRFLKGWSPDHWKLNSYGEELTRQVLESLPKTD